MGRTTGRNLHGSDSGDMLLAMTFIKLVGFDFRLLAAGLEGSALSSSLSPQCSGGPHSPGRSQQNSGPAIHNRHIAMCPLISVVEKNSCSSW